VPQIADNPGVTDQFTARLQALAALEAVHAPIRRRLGLPERDDAVLQRVAALFAPPIWAKSGISLGDAFFLYDLVRAIKPARVAEVGVAAGCSSALLLVALADVHGATPPPSPLLLSADIHSECYFDRTVPVGSAVQDMTPHLQHVWRLHTGATAADLPHLLSLAKSRPLHLAFIDADHRHPAPIADLVSLLPTLAPGAWVALHDIALPDLGKLHEARTGQKVDWNDTGPKLLFEHWPFDKLRGDFCADRAGSRNIGAIRLPNRSLPQAEVLELLAPALSQPWQVEPAKLSARLLDLGRAAA
jgi:predicted O-methyltransferase YrrM